MKHFDLLGHESSRFAQIAEQIVHQGFGHQRPIANAIDGEPRELLDGRISSALVVAPDGQDFAVAKQGQVRHADPFTIWRSRRIKRIKHKAPDAFRLVEQTDAHVTLFAPGTLKRYGKRMAIDSDAFEAKIHLQRAHLRPCKTPDIRT